MQAGLVVETAEVARGPRHRAARSATAPRRSTRTSRSTPCATLVAQGRVPGPVDAAVARYIHALEDGLLKVMSKMGISTMQSYRGAQIFEAVGLDRDARRAPLHRHAVADRRRRARPSSAARRSRATTAASASRRRRSPTSCRSAASTSGGAAASRTSGTRRRSRRCRPRCGSATRAKFAEFERLCDDEDARARHAARAARARRAATAGPARRGRAGRARSCSGSSPARCRSARSAPRRTRRSRSR